MPNFTYFTANVKFSFLAIFLSSVCSLVHAEGTPTVSPTATNRTALLSAPDINIGSFANAGDDNRIKFLISNAGTENMYFGFDWYNYVSTPASKLTNMYWRIKDSATNTVQASGLWSNTVNSAGNIDTYAKAVAGPNIGTTTTGYIPVVFDPTTTGEYYFEFYRSDDGGNTALVAATNRAVGSLFDMTVANNSGTFSKINGRVYSDRWGFVAVQPANNNINPFANAEPVLYSYTPDQTVIKIDYETGFQPIAFTVAVNSYGTNTAGTFDVSRKSVSNATAPTQLNGFKVFLNIPDVNSFPISPIPANPTFRSPAVSGCGPYSINFSVAEPGDVKLLLNLNNIAGYQSGSADRIIEVFNVVAGNNTASWDGLNGLGVAVAAGTNLNLSLTFLKGRFNLPIYDAELNKGGLRISITSPISITNASLWWDDSSLASIGTTCSVAADNANNITPVGINNSLVGSLSPAHAWNGNGNPSQTIPAPAVSGNDLDNLQCNDFGNVATINTWGWGYTSADTSLSLIFGCADLAVAKVVNNASVLAGANVTFTITASNSGPAPSANTVVNDILPSGYLFVSATPSVGSYDNITGIWSIGTLSSGVSVQLTVIATVRSVGVYLNTAVVSGSQIDANLTNNSASSSVVLLQDIDGDGIDDITDLDDDNDGILDTTEDNTSCGTNVIATGSAADCDGDGVPNKLDLDSDNDGINDVDEAGGIDIDRNGIADGPFSATGIPASAGTGVTPPNSDGADGSNPYDTDNDNDGISDLIEAGLNPALDPNNDGIVDCPSNCDPDGDGILAPVDASTGVRGDAAIPDLTPTTEINSLEYLLTGDQKDFVINVFEINNVLNVPGAFLRFRVAKLSAFDITYATTSGISDVFGGINNNNSDWIFTENASFITVTARPGIAVPQNGSSVLGFKARRKVGIPSNTAQNITVTITYGSAGEEKINNNIVETKITAN